MRFNPILGFIVIFAVVTLGCNQPAEPAMKTQEMPRQPSLLKKPFGRTPDGTAVDLYHLTNKNGLEAFITNYGGVVVTLRAPDRNGKLDDIVLGFDELESYLK